MTSFCFRSLLDPLVILISKLMARRKSIDDQEQLKNKCMTRSSSEQEEEEEKERNASSTNSTIEKSMELSGQGLIGHHTTMDSDARSESRSEFRTPKKVNSNDRLIEDRALVVKRQF